MKTRAITLSLVRHLLKPRAKDSHKGTFGHVMIIAGSRAMSGAARLCAAAALRSGAGLVTAAVPVSVQQLVAAASPPEVMTLGLSESADGHISPRASEQAVHFIRKKKISSVGVGPGLGSGAVVNRFIARLLTGAAAPLVMDADGLNALSSPGAKERLGLLRRAEKGCILTPHPGEMSRLTGLPAEEIQNNREKVTSSFAAAHHAVCVLKGNRTVVSDGKAVFINTTGNPGMATGGSGDTLTGIIAALIPQVKEPRLLNAAVCGVYVHGLAGDIAAEEMTEISLIAGDIIGVLPKAFKKIGGKSRR